MTLAMRKRRARRAMRRRHPPPSIDIIVESALWTARREAKTVLRRAIAEAASAVATGGGELAIVLTDDSTIQGLNRNWRRKDAPTNVLSFPVTNHVCPLALAQRHRNGAQTTDAKGRERGAVHSPLGDIVIAYETTEREARAEGKSFADHLAHLAVHGFLHLAGYDHATDAEAKAMELLEAAILTRLDVPNPYIGGSAEV